MHQQCSTILFDEFPIRVMVFPENNTLYVENECNIPGTTESKIFASRTFG